MVIVWILWLLRAGMMMELGFDFSMKLLFHQQPGVRATLHPDAPTALEFLIAHTRVLDYS